MKKKNDSFFNESPYANVTLHPFSNNRELSDSEWIALRLASMTLPRTSEPKTVSSARSRITSAEITRDYLIKNNLIPVFDSFEFEGMALKKVQNGK